MENNLNMPIRQLLSIIQKRTLLSSTYCGVGILKSPMDAWMYQEIIYEIKPDVIIELGNAHGGSALLLAHLCDVIGKGKIIGVDKDHSHIPQIVKDHPRIKLITGDACKSFEQVKQLITETDNIMIIEDSAHTFDNTLAVLRLYSDLIKIGGYFIVEDTICHHGLDEGPSPGPYEAVMQFIHENKKFAIDRNREAFFITWNPCGYLKRVT